jgi:hypothetical protein
MKGSLRSRLPRFFALVLLCLAAPLARAQEKAVVPQGGVVNVTVTTAAPAPPVSITLHERHGHVTPVKGKCTHTGGGLIDVAQSSPDTVVVTMTGVVIANSSMTFDLEQAFEVSFDNPKLKKANLTVEGRVLGLLRGEPKGCARYADACASLGIAGAEAVPAPGVPCPPHANVPIAGAELVTLCVPPHNICGCDSLSVNDHDGPKKISIQPGKYVLHQTFTIAAESSCFFCKRPSAEFAPDPALDPLWISYWEPFHGVSKKDFGFQVTLKVSEAP